VNDACRGIDLNGSVAETQRALAALQVPLLCADDIA
jgi:hypothetical protein